MQRISFILIIALGLASVLIACKSSKTSANNGTDTDTSENAEKISWEVLGEGAYCGIEEPLSRLITKHDEWDSFYKKFGSNRFPAPETPEINFEENALIISLMGMRTSGGHKVEINSMLKEGKTIKVSLSYVAPGENCMVTDALTQPYIFALVSNQNLAAAEFEVLERRDDCNQ